MAFASIAMSDLLVKFLVEELMFLHPQSSGHRLGYLHIIARVYS